MQIVYKLNNLTPEEIKIVEGLPAGKPGRIHLDTNVLQYLQNFGGYIFEHYRKSEDYFRSGNNTTGKGKQLLKKRG